MTASSREEDRYRINLPIVTCKISGNHFKEIDGSKQSFSDKLDFGLHEEFEMVKKYFEKKNFH